MSLKVVAEDVGEEYLVVQKCCLCCASRYGRLSRQTGVLSRAWLELL